MEAVHDDTVSLMISTSCLYRFNTSTANETPTPAGGSLDDGLIIWRGTDCKATYTSQASVISLTNFSKFIAK